MLAFDDRRELKVGSALIGGGFAAHREIHGIRDETEMMRVLVKGLRLCSIAPGGNRHARPQQHVSEESAAILILGHRPDRIVDVIGHDDLVLGAQMQIPQHVARRQRHHEQFFGVVARAIAAKGRIGRSWDDRLAFDRIFMASFVPAVIPGSLTGVAGPRHANRIRMRLAAHS